MTEEQIIEMYEYDLHQFNRDKGLYGTVNMLLKCVFYSAVESDVIKDNPAACINPRGGKAKKEKVALTDMECAASLVQREVGRR